MIDEKILVNRNGQPLQPYPKGVPIFKNRLTIVRGQPERLMWRDEAARARAMARYLAARRGKPAKPMNVPWARWASAAFRRKQ